MSDRSQQGDGYRVLARKYRPKDFSDLIGQEPMVRTLTNAFRTGRIAQAYMLTGVRGVGKTTTARILARALNYKTDTVDEPTIDLSVPGEHCQPIIEGRHVDVIEMDAASHTGIDDIREIIEQVRYRPVAARYKVYIIDEVHMLSTQAFNGLLKTLEEPPEHVKFIFATTEIRKVPITVLSRCQRFDLRRIDAAMIKADLARIAGLEGVEVEEDALAMIARAAEGSMRDAQSIFDQAIAHGGGSVEADAVRSMLGLADRGRIIDLFQSLARGDVASAIAEFQAQYDVGANPPVVLTDLAEFTHLVTRLKFVPRAAEDPALSEAERMRGIEFSEKLGVPALSRFWQMLLKGIAETESSNRPYQTAEMVLIRLAHAATLPSPEDAARLLSERRGEGASQSAADREKPSGRHDSGARAQNPAPSSSPPPSPSARQGMITTADQGQTGARMMLREVEKDPAAHQDVGVAENKDEQPTGDPAVNIGSLDDIVALASEHRDIKMKTWVRNCVRPVRVEPGRLEIGLTVDAPKALAGDLSGALERWTGRRWVVTVSRDADGQTIAEAENAERDNLVRDARDDPDVAAILAQFPGARITDVRISLESEDATLEMPDTDGDMLPEGDTDDP